jgi:2-keto-3-deoxy-6-phosphogluconate aldolase
MTDPLAAFLDRCLSSPHCAASPAEIPAVGSALVAHGFRILEVPLNSRPFESIRRLARAFGDRCLSEQGP